jgi:UDP-N-acetyl-2-amino-2-deoxyglucuronate dehydrogenase
VAVCDTNPATLKAHAETHGVPGFANLSRMLQEVTPDLVAICTPSGLHPEEAITVARHGVHVMTEKPMATRWQDGLRMVRACDDAGVHLFVVKQNRRNATLKLLKQAVEQKRFGRIYSVAVNVFWTRPQDYYDSARWRGTWEFDGGAFMNQASHYVDLLDWIIGHPLYYDNVINTLRGEAEPETSGREGLRSLELLIAMYLSARDGKRIALPLEY